MNAYALEMDELIATLREMASTRLPVIAIGVSLLTLLLIFLCSRKGRPIPDECEADGLGHVNVAAARLGANDTVATTLPTTPDRPCRPVDSLARRHAILIVDDSLVVRTKLRRLFERADLATVAVCDGVEALDELAKSFFSVLVTDLDMPNMGGIELIAQVQGSLDTEDMPIIAITGHDELRAHVRDCQSLYGIFRKPWNDRALLKRVQALCALRTLPAAPAAGSPDAPEPA